MEIILTVISTVISMAIGALITWWVSKYYYEKAGKELESEASELKNLNRDKFSGLFVSRCWY